MRYRVSPLNKKSVVENEYWTKDGEVLKRSVVWRWGSVFVNEKPENQAEDEELNVYDEWDCELESCDDGCSEDWEYPESWSDEQIEAFQEAFQEEYYDAIEALGFKEDDTELWFIGELKITEVEE